MLKHPQDIELVFFIRQSFWKNKVGKNVEGNFSIQIEMKISIYKGKDKDTQVAGNLDLLDLHLFTFVHFYICVHLFICFYPYRFFLWVIDKVVVGSACNLKFF